MLTIALMVALLPFIAVLAPYITLVAINRFAINENNEIDNKSISTVMSFIILLIGYGTALSTILLPRDLSVVQQYNEELEPGLAAFNLSRFTTIIIIIFSMSLIFKMINQTKMPRSGLSIWLSYVLYGLTTIILPLFTGTVSTFKIQLLYAPIVLTGCYLYSSISDKYIISISKYIMLFYAYASIVAAILAPSWAIQSNYESFIPGIDFRLFGIGGANSIGPLMAVYLAIEFIHPTRSKVRVIHIFVVTTVLLLTQCKAAWVLIIVCSILYMFGKIARRYFPKQDEYNKCLKTVFVTFSLFVIICVIFVAVGIIQPLSYVTLDSFDRGEEVATLTGRTALWAISLAAWETDPIFGYGIGLWDTDFRSYYGMDWAGHAHNQFIHTLASTGLVGLAGLIVYLLSCLIAAIRVRKINSIPLVLLCAIFVSCITETPLLNHGILTIFFFLHLLMFLLLTQALKQQEML